MIRAIRTLAALFLFLVALPAQAAVTITFWSHELGNSFPHAFFTLRGTVDATGEVVDSNYGFTAKALTPALLMGSVPGRLDIAKPDYIASSTAQFSIVLTDAQYAQILSLTEEWGDKGDHHYNLGNRNCIHFVKEAARRLGLVGLDQPKLMKKPRSYLQAVDAANVSMVTTIAEKGEVYLASLPALPAVAAVPPPVAPTLPVTAATATN